MSIEYKLKMLVRDKHYSIFGLFIALKKFITLSASLLEIILKPETQFLWVSIESKLKRLALDKYYSIFGPFIALKKFITLPTSLLKTILKPEK
jgi:hypothetical protein